MRKYNGFKVTSVNKIDYVILDLDGLEIFRTTDKDCFRWVLNDLNNEKLEKCNEELSFQEYHMLMKTKLPKCIKIKT